MQGTGSLELDVQVCTRALGDPALSPLTRASVLVARARARLLLRRPEDALTDADAALASNAGSAAALEVRGRARRTLGRHRQALADFDAAVALSPGFATAYRERGITHLIAGEDAAAIRDLDGAIGIRHGDPVSHVARGIARYGLGDNAGALEDFEQARDLGTAWPYLDLWSSLAARGAGQGGAPALERSLAALDEGEWPAPLLELYLGRRGAAEVLRQVDGEAPILRALRLAPARFYVAELWRVEGRAGESREMLRSALEAPDVGHIELDLARRRLRAAGG